MLEQRAALKALGQVLDHQHVVPGAAAGLKGKAHLVFLHRALHPLHLFQPLFPALGGADGLFPVKLAIAGDDGLLAGDFGLLQVVLLEPALQVGLALAGEGVVIALVLLQPGHGQLGHGIAHRVQEIAVMAHHQHRALIFL